MVYADYTTCLSYTIVVRNPRFKHLQTSFLQTCHDDRDYYGLQFDISLDDLELYSDHRCIIIVNIANVNINSDEIQYVATSS